jgi:hypothetical protein
MSSKLSTTDIVRRRADILAQPSAKAPRWSDAASRGARRGVGAFDYPREVATIAVLPHDDRLGFAVAERLDFTSLSDIAAARYPLRISVRGSLDACTPVIVDVVLRAHGFGRADIRDWGGEVSYDQPMPGVAWVMIRT